MSAHARILSPEGRELTAHQIPAHEKRGHESDSGLEPLQGLPHMKVRCAVVQVPACHTGPSAIPDAGSRAAVCDAGIGTAQLIPVA